MSTAIARLGKIESACRTLAELKTVGEAKDFRDRMQALQAYLKQSGFCLQAQNDAAELKLRAERKIGDLLAETVENHRPAKVSHDVTVLPDGISRMQSSRFQRIASVPEKVFVRHIRERKHNK